MITKDINLLPKEIIGEIKIRKLKRLGVLIYILIVTAMFSYILIPLNYMLELNSKKEGLIKGISIKETIVQKENELKEINLKLSLRQTILEKSQSEKLEIVNILDKIESFIPQELNISSITASEKSFVIVGTSSSDIVIADFIEKMKKSEMFAEIFVPGIVKKGKPGEVGAYAPYDFSMECSLKK